MMKASSLCMGLLMAFTSALAEEAPEGGVKSMLGMSVLGNQEAPKSLVIVPWKSSEQGDRQQVSSVLDDRARPVDRDVFLRELSYYQLRTGGDGSMSSR
jgi:hypothetical protein